MTNSKPIVVGVDFSPCSAVALKQALRLGGLSHAPVRAVHAIDTIVGTQQNARLSSYQARIRAAVTEDAAQAWKEFATSIPGAADVPFDFELDSRTRAILALAARHSAQLLVLGAFGDRRPDVGFGTVATACVRHAHCDVLLVRDTQLTPFQRIVVGIDFSENSQRALEGAVRFARQDGAPLHIVYCFDAPWRRLHYRSPTLLTGPEEQEQFRLTLDQEMRAFSAPALQDAGSIRVEFELVDAPAHRAGLVTHAEEVGADLVVLGTRGRSNLRDILLGSTAEKVLAESRCSVLAVRC